MNIVSQDMVHKGYRLNTWVQAPVIDLIYEHMNQTNFDSFTIYNQAAIFRPN